MLYDHIKKTIADLGYTSFSLETVSFILHKDNPWQTNSFNELYFVQSVLNPINQFLVPVHIEASNVQECLTTDVLLPKFYATYYTGQMRCYLSEDTPEDSFVYMNLIRCIPSI